MTDKMPEKTTDNMTGKTSDSNLPETAKNRLPERAMSKLRQNQALTVGALLTSAGALGLFFLTQYTFASFAVGAAGLLLLAARQLVRKSLVLTEDSPLQIASTATRLEQIRKQVSKCKFLESVETEGTKAAGQAEQLLNQYKQLKAVLGRKFSTTEITYSRYLESIEASCLSIGENLDHTRNILENLSVTRSNKDSHWQEQRNHVVSLLQSTDQALLGLAALFNSVNEITTNEKNRNQLEQSMLQIKELAERAKIYSK